MRKIRQIIHGYGTQPQEVERWYIGRLWVGWVIIPALVILLLVFLYATGVDARPNLADIGRHGVEPYRPGSVAVLGDSITFLAPWPDGVVNLGCRGHTTADALYMFELVVKSHPSVLVLWLGTNDILQHSTKFYDNYLALLGRIAEQLPDTEVVIVSILPNLYDSTVILYNTWLEELAKVNGFRYVNVHDLIHSRLYFKDGLHPNLKGYEIILPLILWGLLTE